MNTDDYIKAIHTDMRVIADDVQKLTSMCAGFEQNIRHVIADLGSEKQNRKNDKLSLEAADRLAQKKWDETQLKLDTNYHDLTARINEVEESTIKHLRVMGSFGAVVGMVTGWFAAAKGWFS